MEVQEAIEILKQFQKDTPKLPYDCLANKEIEAVSVLLNEYEKQQKEIKENKENWILAQNEVLGYAQGYKDGKQHKQTATAMIVENRQYQIIEEEIKRYKIIIEKQQKEIQKLEARKYMFNAETGEITQIPIDNNYINKNKIKEKIEELKFLLYSFEKKQEEKLEYVDKGSMNSILAQISILNAVLEEQ